MGMFLMRIPSQIMANSAFRCNAFARAAWYYEKHLREVYDPDHFGMQDSRVCTRTTHDATSLPLPPLSESEASYLRDIYAKLFAGESSDDTVAGLVPFAARLKFPIESSSATRETSRHQGSQARIACFQDSDVSLTMLGSQGSCDGNEGVHMEGYDDLIELATDHEQDARWGEAMACYEQALRLMRLRAGRRRLRRIQGEALYQSSRKGARRTKGNYLACMRACCAASKMPATLTLSFSMLQAAS